MKSRHISQAGFGHIAAVFALLFVAVVGFAGYKVVTMNKAGSTTASTAAVSTKAPEKISTKADLVQTSKALDSSSTSVSSGLNDSSLNSDLNDML
jgi:hypothetical protein